MPLVELFKALFSLENYAGQFGLLYRGRAGCELANQLQYWYYSIATLKPVSLVRGGFRFSWLESPRLQPTHGQLFRGL